MDISSSESRRKSCTKGNIRPSPEFPDFKFQVTYFEIGQNQAIPFPKVNRRSTKLDQTDKAARLDRGERVLARAALS